MFQLMRARLHAATSVREIFYMSVSIFIYGTANKSIHNVSLLQDQTPARRQKRTDPRMSEV